MVNYRLFLAGTGFLIITLLIAAKAKKAKVKRVRNKCNISSVLSKLINKL